MGARDSQMHELALNWFIQNEGRIVSWPSPLNYCGQDILLATKAKGIYKPKWLDCVLSIRQNIGSEYPDEDPENLHRGPREFRYYQEDMNPDNFDKNYTNVAMKANIDSGIPVGVLRQVSRKPNSRYKVMGLAVVCGWADGFFTLRNIKAGDYDPLSKTVKEQPNSRISKEEIAKEIANKLDISEPLMSSGSTLPRSFLYDVACELRIENIEHTGKVELAELILSRLSQTINQPLITVGSTVTTEVLRKIREGVENMTEEIGIEDEENESDMEGALGLDITNRPELSSGTRSVKKLLRQMRDGTIIIPPFQRNFIWSKGKQRALIESILLGIPLPSIVLIEDSETGNMMLVDGLQRMRTLENFIHDVFDVGNLEANSIAPLSGKKFSELPDEFQSVIKSCTMAYTEIEGMNDRQTLYELFRRYNTGGVNLNAAEIRNAVYHDNLVHKMLVELAGEVPGTTAQDMSQETRNLRDRLGFSNRVDERNRFKVYNFLCRYFGYSRGTTVNSTTKCIVEFMEKHAAATPAEAALLKNEIIDIATKTTRLFSPRYAFKMIDSENNPTTRFGAWPFTLQMVGTKFLLDSGKLDSVDENIIRHAWVMFYSAEMYGVPQNQRTLWGSQEKWLQILSNISS